MNEEKENEKESEWKKNLSVIIKGKRKKVGKHKKDSINK